MVCPAISDVMLVNNVRLPNAPAAHHGFGYDPLLLITELAKTTVELPPEQKHRISHRGKALRHLKSLFAARPA